MTSQATHHRLFDTAIGECGLAWNARGLVGGKRAVVADAAPTNKAHADQAVRCQVGQEGLAAFGKPDLEAERVRAKLTAQGQRVLADKRRVLRRQSKFSGRRGVTGQALLVAAGLEGHIAARTLERHILLAARVPLAWGLGFAGTLSMLGMAYSLLVDRTAWLAAIVSAAAAVATFALPLKLNILAAIAAAVTVSLVMMRVDKTRTRAAT